MIRAIAAIDRKLGIGKDGTIPWELPTDQRYFTEQTKQYGGHVLTGLRTYSLTYHGPLKDRTNYIVTHDSKPIPGAVVVNDLDTFLSEFTEDLWIAGGADIFQQTLNRTDELYLTHIDGVFDCDRFFPAYKDKFELATQSKPLTENGLTFTFCIYRRKH